MLNECDNEWLSFLNNGSTLSGSHVSSERCEDISSSNSKINFTDLYISTKTSITYLTSDIDLKDIFPKLIVIPFHSMKEGIIKKTMKYNFISSQERDKTLNILQKHPMFIDKILKKQMSSPFKDVRKISIGLSNKDIISYRRKDKGAFYNCFVIMIRIKHENIYKECHVKIFNTGKVEIPGVKDNSLMHLLQSKIIDIFKTCGLNNIKFKNIMDVVLINSNFDCGFNINREKLASIFKHTYNLNTSYDPCSYPGIMCKFYYNDKDNIHNGIEDTNKRQLVSFMVFRTGSILIVGKCTEDILYSIYNFLKDIIKKEYSNIYVANKLNSRKLSGVKKERRRTIIVFD